MYVHLTPLTLARAWGVDATPHEFFWNGFRTAERITLTFCIADGASFAQLLAKNDQVMLGHGAMTS